MMTGTAAGDEAVRTPEELFGRAQARLLAASGTQAAERVLTLPAPPMRVHVLEAGAGPPVVFLHGGNSVAAGWEPLLGLLQRDLRLVAPDRPGCGLSDPIDYRGVADFREHAVAFVRSVLDAVGLPRASLVGNSIGGYWALVFALACPERVERVVLVGEPAGASPTPSIRHRVLATPWLNRLLAATVLKPRRDRTRAQMGAVVAHPERLSEPFLDLAYAAARLPGAQLAWWSMVERVACPFRPVELTYAVRTELRQLQCPVLMIWGDRDGTAPHWGEQLCQVLPFGRLEVLPDTGHLPWLDAPQQVAALLRDFLTLPQPPAPSPGSLLPAANP